MFTFIPIRISSIRTITLPISLPIASLSLFLSHRNWHSFNHIQVKNMRSFSRQCMHVRKQASTKASRRQCVHRECGTTCEEVCTPQTRPPFYILRRVLLGATEPAKGLSLEAKNHFGFSPSASQSIQPALACSS